MQQIHLCYRNTHAKKPDLVQCIILIPSSQKEMLHQIIACHVKWALANIRDAYFAYCFIIYRQYVLYYGL